MFKLYFKQALHQLKENKLISFISILGTALAICMIMVIVLMLQVRIKDCVPEVNRSRSLYVKCMSIRELGSKGGSSNSGMSVTTARECFKSLTTPEAVAIISINEKVHASVSAGTQISADKMETDEAFWQVFSFRFISGKPYTKADFDSGLPKAVITADVARQLYGMTDVTGRTIQINRVDYAVAGVVENVSKLAIASYSQIWIPYTSTDIAKLSWWKDAMGGMRAIILARSADDFPAIRSEVERFRQIYNAKLKDSEIFYRGQPDTQLSFLYRHWGEELNMQEIVLRFVVIVIILLLVPAINLSGITLSRMRKRTAEIGVRKAFGATAGELLKQVFLENLILTLIAGAIGMIMSYFFVYVLSQFLFGNRENAMMSGDMSFSGDMLFSPLTFFVAFCFCLLLNLLSAGIPAWRTSRLSIINALNQR